MSGSTRVSGMLSSLLSEMSEVGWGIFLAICVVVGSIALRACDPESYKPKGIHCHPPAYVYCPTEEDCRCNMP
jgi:hypothetical protein